MLRNGNLGEAAGALVARRSVRMGLIAAAVLVAGLALAQGKPDTANLAVQEIEVSARPIAAFDKSGEVRTRVGKLEWRGGLVLSSSMEAFGGWSGLAFDPDGETLLAVSDAGTWMRAKLVYDGDRPKGLAGVEIGPLSARKGQPLTRARDRDAEALALAEGSLAKGSLFVGFENNARIGRFPVVGGKPAPPTSYVSLPPETRRMGRNSFEAVTVLSGGRYAGVLLALAEFPLKGEKHHAGWLWLGGLPKRFDVTGIGGFGITDAASLSGGDVLLLERRFQWSEGVRIRLRRIRAADVKPGAVLSGEVLLEADMSHEIDNMEALAVRERADGETLITILSDDNFNKLLQRTLLLEFALTGGARAAAAPSRRDRAQ